MNAINALWTALEAAGDRPLLHEVLPDGIRPIPAADTLAAAGAIHTYLEERGIRNGDRVGLLGNNGSAWAAVDLGILAAGAVVVPLYARQDPGELADMLRDCGATLLLAESEDLSEAVTAHLEVPSTLWREALATPSRDLPRYDHAPDDLVTLIYTSGTSGPAKGVMIHRRNIDFMLPVTKARLDEAIGELPEERAFHYLPFCFAGSRMVLWTQLLRQRPLYLSMDLTRLIDEIPAARPHWFLNVPALLDRIRRGVDGAIQSRPAPIRALYKEAHEEAPRGWKALLSALGAKVLFPTVRKRLGGEVRFLICGSAPLSPETQAWFDRLGLPVLQVYGLTETTAILTMDRPGEARPGWVGTAVDGVDLRLSDEGEILARGACIFSGYWGRGDATQEALQEGWFATGDLGEIDGMGRLCVHGRARSLLVLSSGHNVVPEPLESRLREALPDAEQVVVIGHGRPWLAALVFGTATPEDAEALLKEVNTDVPHYRMIRRLRGFPQALTPESGLLTANQKLRRNAIVTAYAEDIDRLYAEERP